MANRPRLRSQACGAGLPEAQAEGRLLLPHPVRASLVQVSPVPGASFPRVSSICLGRENVSGPRSFGSEVSRPLAAPLPCPILAAELPAAVGTASEDGRGGVGAAGAALAASGLPLEGHGAQLPFPRGGTLRLGRRRRARSSDRLPAAKLESGWAPHAPRLPLAQASLAPPACDRHSLIWPGGVAGATDLRKPCSEMGRRSEIPTRGRRRWHLVPPIPAARQARLRERRLRTRGAEPR